MYPNARIQTNSAPRSVPDLFDSLKAEYENIAHEATMYKMQRDEFERKLQSQLQELNNIQTTMYELERAHQKIKQQYEEDILRLRRQIEMQGGTPVPTHSLGVHSSYSLRGTSPGVVAPLSQAPIISPSPVRSASQSTEKETKRSVKRQREESHYGTGNNNNAPASENSAKQQKTIIHEEDRRSKDDERKSSEDTSVDWIVGYNPGVQTDLNIDMLHNFEHQSVVCCVKFSNDGKHLATGCNKSAQIYDVETGEKVHIFSEDTGKDTDLYIRSVCFSPDNRYLAAGAEDKTVKIWDIKEKRLKQTFVGHELDIYSLDYSRDGNFIISGSGDKKSRIWDVEKGECLFILGNDEVGPKDGVTSVAFSPDGRLVAAGSLDRIVRLWDAQTGYFLERYEGHSDSVYSVAFSPDGKTLASGSLDKTLKLWDLSGSRARSRCRSTFSGHKDFVLSVAFSHDGNWLISGSKDRSVQFWDPRNAVTHMMLQGHKNSVLSVAVSPTGGVFATGSGDFRARCWKYD